MQQSGYMMQDVQWGTNPWSVICAPIAILKNNPYLCATCYIKEQPLFLPLDFVSTDFGLESSRWDEDKTIRQVWLKSAQIHVIPFIN